MDDNQSVTSPLSQESNTPGSPAPGTSRSTDSLSEGVYAPQSGVKLLPSMENPIDDKKSPAMDAREVKKLVSDDMVDILWKRADKLQENLAVSVHSLRMGIQLLDLIKSARSELLAGKEHYVKAERFVNEVEFQLAVREKVLRSARQRGFLLTLYELIWAIVSFLLFFGWASQSGLAGNSVMTEIMNLVACMAWGGVGGVMGAWFSLLKHVAVDQDFDPQHTLWYISSPVMGYGVGAVVYIILRAGLLSLGGTAQEINSPYILYITAWLAGYQHNLFTDIVKRLLKVFKVEEEEKA